jgi:hypothetical protein
VGQLAAGSLGSLDEVLNDREALLQLSGLDVELQQRE